MSRRARPRAVLAAVGAFGLMLLAAPHALASGTPTTPTELFNSFLVCSNDANAPTYVPETGSPQGVYIEGVPAPVGTTGSLAEQFRVWPVSDPTQTTSLIDQTSIAGFDRGVTVPAGVLTDGQTYAWQAQTVEGTAVSDWSAPCYFTLDNTAPSQAPTISSANYPEDQRDQPGEPVDFTFDANGVGDVEGFEFDWQSSLPVLGTNIGAYTIPQPVDPYDDPKHFVRANALGGSATVSLIPPYPAYGPVTLYVRSLDRAFHVSSTVSYGFVINGAAPAIAPVKTPQFDKPATFDLTPNAQLQAKSPTVSYTVRTEGALHDQTIQVPAASDGTAEVELTLDGANGEYLEVSSTSANGWVSAPTSWKGSFDTTTTVTSEVYPENTPGGGAGVPGAFTFTPKVKGVASYTYSFNGGDPVTVKAADDDQPTTITWTPTSSGGNDLYVYATTKDGIKLADTWYFFNVN
ncbi:MAG: hypothetical protein HOY79_27425 [Streptomyces sp.]|nr:hypothetical protein [Streptomyces sp.]